MTSSRQHLCPRGAAFLRGAATALGFAVLFAATSAAQGRRFAIDDALGVASVSDPQLSPDGAFVAYVVSRIDLDGNKSKSRIHGVPFAGGDTAPLTRAGRSASHPRFSPDGSYLAFLSSGDGDRSQIWLLPLTGGEARVLSNLPGGVSSFSWAPDASALAAVSMDPDPDEPEEGEDPEPVPLVIDRRQFKRDGRGYLDDRRRHIYVVDASDASHAQRTFGPYDDGSPAFSPDSTEIAFVSVRPLQGDPDATDNSDIFLVPRDGDRNPEPVRLTSNPGPDRSPVFSPDGRWLAHTGNRKPELIWYATEHLYVLNRATDEIVHVAAALDRFFFFFSEPQGGSEGAFRGV